MNTPSSSPNCKIFNYGNGIFICKTENNKFYVTYDNGNLWKQLWIPDDYPFVPPLSNIKVENSENRIIQKLKEEGVL